MDLSDACGAVGGGRGLGAGPLGGDFAVAEGAEGAGGGPWRAEYAGAFSGRDAGAFASTRSASGALAIVESTGGGTVGGNSLRDGPVCPDRLSCVDTSSRGRSDTMRSEILSALGPVGGTIVPDGTLVLGAAGAGSAAATAAGAAGAEGAAGGAGTGAAGATGTGLTVCAGLRGGAAAMLGLASSVGFLQTLDPKAGTAAGGEEGRGAYLSRDASARLASKRSSLPGSRRESLATDGSIAREERRE